MQVHYREEELSAVLPVHDQVERALLALEGLAETSPAGQIELYLHRVSRDESLPHVEPFGPGIFTGVYFLDPATSPDAWLDANRVLFEVMIHELAHVALEDLKLKDRWLEDGLPEVITSEAARQLGFDSSIRRFWEPRQVALFAAPVEAWDYKGINRVIKISKKDPDLAMLLTEKEIWRYSAAEGLLDRWISTREDRSAALRDLLTHLRAARGSIDWEETRELCLELTGRSLEDLAEVTEEQKAEARRAAWASRTDREIRARIHALRTLAFWGLPPGVEADDLTRAVTEDFDDNRGLWLWSLYNAAGEALSHAPDPEVGLELVRLAQLEPEEPDYRLIPPKLWRVLAPKHPQQALRKLADLVRDEGSRLRIRDEANGFLEELTGEVTGWSLEAKPARRQEAAERWQQVIRGALEP